MNDCGRWSSAKWQEWVNDGLVMVCREHIVRCRRELIGATVKDRVRINKEIKRYQMVMRLR